MWTTVSLQFPKVEMRVSQVQNLPKCVTARCLSAFFIYMIVDRLLKYFVA